MKTEREMQEERKNVSTHASNLLVSFHLPSASLPLFSFLNANSFHPVPLHMISSLSRMIYVLL